MELQTPSYDLSKYGDVYEPSEDTFLFLDALEAEAPFLINMRPKVAVEVGSGSGIVITSLALILKDSCAYFSTDINAQACAATKNTSSLNSVSVECINMDLLSSFKNELFDVVLFNPPYVVTNSSEICGSGLNRAWAGGENGREVIDKFLSNITKMLTADGVLYLVLLKENRPQEVIDFMKNLYFKSELVLHRKIPGELLFIYKFYRNK